VTRSRKDQTGGRRAAEARRIASFRVPSLRLATLRAAAVVLGLAAVPATAADDKGDFAIKGAGLQTCGKFLLAWDKASPDLAQYGGWITGYLTGMNQHVAGTFDAAPWQTTETLLGMTRSVCQNSEPDLRFMEAFNILMRSLLPLRLNALSELEGVRDNDSTLVIYREVLRVAKQRLKAEGFDPGSEDGVFSDQTDTALRAFQTARGLQVTGMPDQQTLFQLFLKPSGSN
jgi:hypothetical protein